MLIRTTVISVAVQALIARLLMSGALSQGDIVVMRETGLQLAADLAELGGKQLSGERMTSEVEAWWDTAVGLAAS